MVTALTLHVTIATPYILAVSNQSIVVLFWGATALTQTNIITYLITCILALDAYLTSYLGTFSSTVIMVVFDLRHTCTLSVLKKNPALQVSFWKLYI